MSIDHISDERKTELQATLEKVVERINGREGKNHQHVCPLCGSGTKANHTPAFTIYPATHTFKCFSCGRYGDVFQLIEYLYGITTFPEQVRKVQEILCLNATAAEPHAQTSTRTDEQPPQKQDYTKQIEEWHRHIIETDYFQKRGLTAETIEKFNLGYAPDSQEVIFPYENGNYYIARSTAGKKYRFPQTFKAGAKPLFNGKCLAERKPCFICESQIDAISIMQAVEGVNAVATGGTSGINLILNADPQSIKADIILNFDNDEPGRKAEQELATALTARKQPYSIAEYHSQLKDPNEMLCADSTQFAADILQNVEEHPAKALRQTTKSNQTLTSEIYKTMLAGTGEPFTPTGFPELDSMLGGGIFPQLYIIGAISSLGKTTFCLQIAEQIAAQGRPVIFVALEQSAKTLASKIISRYTFLLCENGTNNAKTANQLTKAGNYGSFNFTERELVNRATEEARKNTTHLFYIENDGKTGLKQILEKVQECARIYGKPPVLIIDYLQILYDENERLTDKQKTDRAVIELQRITREEKVPVIAISSLNRSSYKSKIDLEAFKESGAIEYSSDVLIGLQPEGMSSNNDNTNVVAEHKANAERRVELVILKNRNGATGGTAKYKYHAMFNDFEEVSTSIRYTGATRKGRI